MELDGKVAIVTGGAVRLGRALALAEQGVRVGVHYGSSTGPAEIVVNEIKAMGSDAVAIQADRSQPGEARTIVERAAAHLGQVDILVNSAAIVEMFARRLQVQERMTQEIAEFMDQTLHPLGVAVVAEGLHMCAAMRGVKKASARMVTSAMVGTFKKSQATRNQFFGHLGREHVGS